MASLLVYNHESIDFLRVKKVGRRLRLLPLGGESLEETFNNIINKQLEFHEGKFSGVSEEAKNFLSAILERDIKKRPSAAEVSKLPAPHFFTFAVPCKVKWFQNIVQALYVQ